MGQVHSDRRARDLCRNLLRREPADAEVARWAARLAEGMSFEDAFYALVRSNDAESRRAAPHPTQAAGRAKSAGGIKPGHPPGHFYSPIVDPAAAAAYFERYSNPSREDIAGIELDLDAMRRFWHAEASVFGYQFREPGGPDRYHREATHYPESDAITLRAMIHHHRPRRMIEVGSGWSSACALDAAEAARLEFRLTCIEPFPKRLRQLLRPGDEQRVTVLEDYVQNVPSSVFADLEARDILLIDSSHVLKTGSDVHHELFHILPTLKDGVLVHFHDCRWPFEYPSGFVFERGYSWNEAYAVRALLMYSTRFKVAFYGGLFARACRAEVMAVRPEFLKNVGSALWVKVER